MICNGRYNINDKIAGALKEVEMARKAAEIADSDGESDVDVAPTSLQSQQSQQSLTNGQSSLPNVDLGVDFNEFLGQSQNYAVTQSQQSAPTEPQSEAAAGKSTGTTASLQRQIESEQRKLAQNKSSSGGRLMDIKNVPVLFSSDSPIVAKTKRRHSELFTTGQMDGGRDPKRKRQTRYGSSGSQLTSSQSDMFMDEHRIPDRETVGDQGSSAMPGQSSDQPEGSIHGDDDQAEYNNRRHQDEVEQHAHLDQDQLALHEHDEIQPQLRGPGVDTDGYADYMQLSSGRISTTRSLMGNHESINLIYRGSGHGLDIDANPFGDVSEPSAKASHDQTERISLEAIFRPSNARTMNAVPFSSNKDHDTCKSFGQTHPGTAGGENLEEAENSRQTSGRSRSYIDPSVLMKDSLGDAHGFSPAKSTSSRKRRKTDEGLAVNLGSSMQDQHDLPPVGNEIDPASMAEEQPKKRGRKPKNQTVESRDDLRFERMTDQDDNEKSVVDKTGLKERHPSSEPHLDDESTIDLPQEQYKPRPSRSRSKRTVDEEMPPPSHTPVNSIQTPVKQTQTSNADQIVQLDDSEDTPLTKLKKEKRKKNKMKRAKTSAAALLKKSDKMLSDGEEDIIWVDSKPVIVKMKLPDPLEVKRKELEKYEGGDAVRTKADLTNATEVDTEEQLHDNPQADSKPQAQAPKKRGRKKKAVIEVPAPIDDEEDPNEAADPTGAPPLPDPEALNPPKSKPSSSSSRSALQEKPINISHPTHPTHAPPAEAHQPSKSNAPPSHTDNAPSDPPSKPLRPPPTPTPPAPSAETGITQPTATTRGPTGHSPINPSGGKVKYRVGLSRRATIPPLLKIVRK